ncbi:triose-phosphate isomerase [Listeria monocytogenes]|nr:triose-phosphate isomerase [Listeria monocytogenes]PDB58959.1 triose-phosphate isomerase [Listeria monocytogenes]
MRKPLVGINMKNYINTRAQTSEWLEATIPLLGNFSDVDTFIFPSMGTLETTANLLAGTSFGFGPQNMAPEKSGPLTGEFSVESIIDLSANYVEIGHAERKNLFHEKTSEIAKKIKLALDEKITPVVCVGEGIRAAQIHDSYSAERARKSNDAHIMTMGALVIGPSLAVSLLDTWLDSDFSGGRSQAKVDLMEEIDQKNR